MLLLAPAVAGCGELAVVLPSAAAGTLRIVSSFPLRGPNASQSRLMNEAIDLAITQHAVAPGGRNFEHIALDGGSGDTGEWSAAVERANAVAAVADSSVVAYIGPANSGAARASLPVTNRAGLLQLSPSMTWPGLTLPGYDPNEPSVYNPSGVTHFVRALPPDAYEGRAAAEWAEAIGVHSVYILSDGSTYSDGLARQFEVSATGRGVAVTGRATVGNPKRAGWEWPVARSGAGAVFFAPSTVGNAIAAARALNALPKSVPVIASDTALTDSFLEGAGAAGERWLVVWNGLLAPLRAPGWSSFESAFRRAYGDEPSQFAANAFDLTSLVLDVASTGERRDRAEVARQVLATSGYPGSGSLVSFDANGDPKNWSLTGFRIEGAKFIPDRTLSGP